MTTVINDDACIWGFGGGGTDLPFSSGTRRIVRYTEDTTLILSDLGAIIECDSDTSMTITIPAFGDVPYPVGIFADIVQVGVGSVTIVGAVGVTVESNGLVLDEPKSMAYLYRRDTVNNFLFSKFGVDKLVKLQDVDVNTIAANRYMQAYVDGGGKPRFKFIDFNEPKLWGTLTGNIDNQADLKAKLDSKANVVHTHDASAIVSGVLDIARIPKGAIERMYFAANAAARLALTTNEVQNGDTVQEIDTKLMFYVVDDTQLNVELGYQPYTAKQASAVDWTGVKNRPQNVADIEALAGSDNDIIMKVGGRWVSQTPEQARLFLGVSAQSGNANIRSTSFDASTGSYPTAVLPSTSVLKGDSYVVATAGGLGEVEDVLIASVDAPTNTSGIGGWLRLLGRNALMFLQSGAGAISQSIQKKLKESVSAKDYGAKGDGVTDDSAAIQIAINTGFNVKFPAGFYLCNNLTQATVNQVLFSDSKATLIKNANGAILTSSANNFSMKNIAWRGDASTPTFTGDGVVSSGSDVSFLNCGGYWISGRALKCTGAHVQISGTNSIYQTSDATATGYDIELGVAGTATLYHKISDVYSTQSTGGILATSCGTWSMSGCQTGKITLISGGAPAGSGAGRIVDNRITGAVYVDASNGVFEANQFSGSTVTFTANGTNAFWGISNVMQTGSTFVNSAGVVSPWIEKNVTADDATTRYAMRVGDDSSLFKMRMNPADASLGIEGNFLLRNTKSIQSQNAAGSGYFNLLNVDSSNNLNLGSPGINSMVLSSGSSVIYFNVGGSTRWAMNTTQFAPQVDNVSSLGSASQRASVIYAGTGTINTSDGRSKQDVRELSDAEKRVAVQCKSLIRAYRFIDSVEAKGDGARIHFGAIAQDVKAAFESEGLVAENYGILCYDVWDELQEEVSIVPAVEAIPEVLNYDGSVKYAAIGGSPEERTVLQAYQPSGNRYGIRYDEFYAFILSIL